MKKLPKYIGLFLASVAGSVVANRIIEQVRRMRDYEVPDDEECSCSCKCGEAHHMPHYGMMHEGEVKGGICPHGHHVIESDCWECCPYLAFEHSMRDEGEVPDGMKLSGVDDPFSGAGSYADSADEVAEDGIDFGESAGQGLDYDGVQSQETTGPMADMESGFDELSAMAAESAGHGVGSDGDVNQESLLHAQDGIGSENLDVDGDGKPDFETGVERPGGAENGEKAAEDPWGKDYGGDDSDVEKDGGSEG